MSPTASWNAFAWWRPFWPVVASRTNSVSGCGARQALVDDPADLRQLVHQVRLRVEAAGGVGDHEVGAAGDGGVEGVEDDRAGSASGRVGDDLAARSLGPDPELVDGRGAERVGGREDDAPALRPRSRAASLPIVVVLPVPLTPTTSTIAGPPRSRGVGSQCAASRGDEQPRELRPNGGLGASTSLALARPLDEVHRERGADVAGDQDLLDLVPVGVIVAAAERAAQAGAEPACATSRGPPRAARSSRSRRAASAFSGL